MCGRRTVIGAAFFVTLWTLDETTMGKIDDLLHNQELKDKLYEVIFGTETWAGKTFDVVLIVAIVLSVLMTVFESFVETTWLHSTLVWTEIAFTAFFTVEYVLRVYCSPRPRSYVLSFFGIIDLMSILPVYLGLVVSGARYMIVLRTFRLVRVFRVFKLFNFLNEGNMLLRAMRKSAKKIMVFFLFVLILNVCLGTVMYVVESASNPEFASIPDGIYWSIVTMTTVGYGDITPLTVAGKMISACVMLLGYTIIAVPTGIVTATLTSESLGERNRRQSRRRVACPRCGFVESDPNAAFCRRCGASLGGDNTLDHI